MTEERSVRGPTMGRWLRRRAWLPVITAVTVAIVAHLTWGSLTPTYRATAVLVVPSGATSAGPGDATEANRLAASLAAVIRDDESLIKTAATDLESITGDPVSVAYVRRHVNAVNEADTSLVRVTYTSATRQGAIDGANTIAAALVSPTLQSAVIPSEALRVARSADDATSSLIGRTTTTIVGALLGLVLGLILVAAWERVDRRVDEIEHLREITRSPVFRSAELSPALLLSIANSIAGELPSGGVVAVVAGDRRALAAAEPFAKDLDRVLEQRVSLAGSLGDGDGEAELAASKAAATVMLVSAGQKEALVTSHVTRLGRVGAHPRLSLLVGRK